MPAALLHARPAGRREGPILRLRIVIRGAVQGVGFRPFVHRLARSLGLTGWVCNSTQGVFIEVEGSQTQLDTLLLRVTTELPARAFIQSLESSFLDPQGYTSFEIRESLPAGDIAALILPDIATCSDCLEEIIDPANRRYQYPFTNCTHCGPRFSIITALPYDRCHTTMRDFVMCASCRAEYGDPDDRRFHAQPNACPACGPHLELWNHEGLVLAAQHEALLAAAEALLRGQIVAMKGLGGFQLLADARNEETVQRLRRRKHREEKPLALMYPNLDLARAHCEISDQEKRLLLSPESPVILLPRKKCDSRSASRHSNCEIAPAVAPHNPYFGVMLPYTPLHHLLMAELRIPLVATSGNLSDEPICIDEREALPRLGGIADLFLVHNRPIARHVDDSIVRLMMGRELVLRRARGYAPLPVNLQQPVPVILAVGAHKKNTIAFAAGGQVFASQHIGDLETAQAFAAFRCVIADFERLYEIRPVAIACDQHPEYLSSKFARQYENAGPAGRLSSAQNGASKKMRVIEIQHHFAHVAACMAENQLEGPVLGVSWDGTGYGLDGSIWGGEFLRATDTSFERVAHVRTFRLPGGERAIKEPRRAALGLLYELFGDAVFAHQEWAPVRAFSAPELAVMRKMLEHKLNTPLTSSAGRLFDVIASVIGLRQQTKFEGQAAMELEFALEGCETEAKYPVQITNGRNRIAGAMTRQHDAEMQNQKPATIIDWAPMVQLILHEVQDEIPAAQISAKFHNTLVEAIVQVAQYAGEERIVLSGGCFQNKYLTERAIRRLRQEGFRPYWHQRFPPNDGGIALGQAIAAARGEQKQKAKSKEQSA